MNTTANDMVIALRINCPRIALGSGFAVHAHQRAAIIGYIAMAERCGMRDIAMQNLRDSMHSALVWETTTQADWRTKVSRRPQRGRHHDSWQIREKYTRGTNNDRDYADYAGNVRARFGLTR